MSISTSLPTVSLASSIGDLQQQLADHDYIADAGLVTSIYLALKLNRPLLLEGEAGVGKTEVAKVLAATAGTEVIRLQCYEGLDITHAVYDWNYARQLIEIRVSEERGHPTRTQHDRVQELFGPEFLIERPLLQALRTQGPQPAVLLIDELDRADEEFDLRAWAEEHQRQRRSAGFRRDRKQARQRFCRANPRAR